MKSLKNNRNSSRFFQELKHKKKKEEREYYNKLAKDPLYDKIYRNHRAISGSSSYGEMKATGKEFNSAFYKHRFKKAAKICNMKYGPYPQETRRVKIKNHHKLKNDSNNEIEMELLNYTV